jgi:hypothetical protein
LDAGQKNFTKGGKMLGIAIKQAIQSHLGDYPIRWHGDTAEVCQKKVQLPALVDSMDYPQSVYRQMLGYGLHELGHIRYTDEAPWDWAIENHSRYLGRLINGLEDVRIEKAMILAGADQSFFENTINAALWDGYVKADEQKNIPFILAVEGRRLNGYRLHCQSILDETPWSKELWWALKQGRTAKSTGAVVSIALRLYRRLQ